MGGSAALGALVTQRGRELELDFARASVRGARVRVALTARSALTALGTRTDYELRDGYEGMARDAALGAAMASGNIQRLRYEDGWSPDQLAELESLDGDAHALDADVREIVADFEHRSRSSGV
jgi:hypothetical protein